MEQMLQEWLAQYGLNTMLVGFILWSVLFEIPNTLYMWRKRRNTLKAVSSHLDTFFPAVWNHNPSPDVVSLPRTQWMEESGFVEKENQHYKQGVDKAVLVCILVGACALATHVWWILVLLPMALNVFVKGKFLATEEISHAVFDLKEQPWITRNRDLMNTPTMHVQVDRLPLDFENNPVVSRDIVGLNTSHHAVRNDHSV